MLTNLFFAIPLLAEEQRGEDYDGAHQSLNYLQKLHTRTTLYYFIDFSFLSSPHRCHLSPAEPNVWATKFSPENKTKIFSFFGKQKRKLKVPLLWRNNNNNGGGKKCSWQRWKYFSRKKICDYITLETFSLFSPLAAGAFLLFLFAGQRRKSWACWCPWESS